MSNQGPTADGGHGSAWQGVFDAATFTLADLGAELDDVVAGLKQFDGVSVVSFLAGLLTVPAYQPWTLRIEGILCLALVHARGGRKATGADIDRWLQRASSSHIGRFEDPPEDLFVSRVTDHRGDRRMLTGLWEEGAFYTQLVVDIVLSMPDVGKARPIRASVDAILTLSDLVCERSGLHRYDPGSESIPPPPVASMRGIRQLRSRALLTSNELREAGIDPDDLTPFLITRSEVAALGSEPVRVSTLHMRPVLRLAEDRYLVALPDALTVALRSFVITSMEGGEALFDSALHFMTARAMRRIPLFAGAPEGWVNWAQAGDWRLGNAWVEVDTGHMLRVGFILPSVRLHADGGFLTAVSPDDDVEEAIARLAAQAIDEAERQSGFQRGLQLWVVCGWGKGFDIRLPDNPHRWQTLALSLADLARLCNADDVSVPYLWKAADGLSAIDAAGLRLINMSGLPNLIAWMRQNHGHFAPHGQMRGGHISPEQPGDVLLPTHAMRALRIETDHALDIHAAHDASGRVHLLRRPSGSPLFRFQGLERLYLSFSAALEGDMVIVYEGEATCWVTIEADAAGALRSDLMEMVNTWLPRVARVLEEQLNPEPVNLSVTLRFDDDVDTLPQRITVDEAHLASLVSLDQTRHVARFEAGFLTGARLVDNTAEQLVVGAMVALFVHALSGPTDPALTAALLKAVVPGTVARHIHIIQTRTFHDRIRNALPPSLVTASDIDLATARVGLGWRALPEAHDGLVTGKAECTGFLACVVDRLLADIQEGLSRFGRQGTLVRLLGNLERGAYDEATWRRTSASLLELADDGPDATAVIIDRLSHIAQSTTASRILTEIALCTCKVDGDAISDLDLAALMAKAVLVYQFGGFSDAIHFNALAPEIQVSAMGDLLVRDDFGHMVVNPLLARTVGEQIIRDSPRQRDNYTAPPHPVSAVGRLNETFYRAWTEETGCDIDTARDIIGALDDEAVDQGAAVIALERSKVVALVTRRGVGEDKARAFLAQFTLMHRGKWDQLPPGFAKREIYPWRLGRRLSLLARPILEVMPGDDPLLLIAPGTLQRGFTYVIDQTLNGRLRPEFFRTEALAKDWLGRAGEGHTFNSEVADALRQEGWAVRDNIGLPEVLGTPTERDFGDIDVLAWKAGGPILVIECKDLSFPRNHSEMATLLSEYQGLSPGGKPDRLRKHLDRIRVLTGGIDRLRQFVGEPTAEIEPWFVFSRPVPMQYARVDALAGVHVGQIGDLIR